MQKFYLVYTCKGGVNQPCEVMWEERSGQKKEYMERKEVGPSKTGVFRSIANEGDGGTDETR